MTGRPDRKVIPTKAEGEVALAWIADDGTLILSLPKLWAVRAVYPADDSRTFTTIHVKKSE